MVKTKLTKKEIENIMAYGNKITSKARALKIEVKKNMFTAVIAAFGFIIALVWRDAIKAVVEEIITRLSIDGSGYIYQITISLITTIICVLGILIVSKIKGKEDIKNHL
jgi:hypothetical protein